MKSALFSALFFSPASTLVQQQRHEPAGGYQNQVGPMLQGDAAESLHIP
jgi:hypothetical protein